MHPTQTVLRGGRPPACRLAPPSGGLGIVLTDAQAGVVHAAKLALGFCGPVPRRPPTPFNGCRFVDGKTPAELVHPTQHVLRRSVFLVRGLTKPIDGCCLVLRCPAPVLVHPSDAVLLLAKAPLRQWQQFFKG